MSTKISLMVNITQLIARDLNHVWHPCTQMKDFESCPPLVIEKAQGSYLYTDQGRLIDSISSWWCKSLGHGHPAVIAAIEQQLHRFEHVIAANTTHPALVDLAEELKDISGKQHVFFASDGSSAVEIAMKLAIHAKQLQGKKEKNQFISLKNGYHGETMATMSISDLGIYKEPYNHFGVKCHFIENIPYVSGVDDPLWNDCEAYWPSVKNQLDQLKDQVCALILEPLVQGAGGMLCYSADFLKKLSVWAKANDIFFITDEIMTGLGRTGKWLAAHHADVDADLICLSKGLTSGSVPFSCVMIDHSIYELFYGDYLQGNSFLHSHTYSANPLAVSAALATIQTMRNEEIMSQVAGLGATMLNNLQQVADLTGKLDNVRGIGAIVAADFKASDITRIDQKIYQHALKHGALIRPIGKTLYWLPPLNTPHDTLIELAEITLNSINTVYAQAEVCA